MLITVSFRDKAKGWGHKNDRPMMWEGAPKLFLPLTVLVSDGKHFLIVQSLRLEPLVVGWWTDWTSLEAYLIFFSHLCSMDGSGKQGIHPVGRVLAINIHFGVCGCVVPYLGGVAAQRVVLELAHQAPAVDPQAQVATVIIHELTLFEFQNMTEKRNDRKMPAHCEVAPKA
jgi:hypothetical protein